MRPLLAYGKTQIPRSQRRLPKVHFAWPSAEGSRIFTLTFRPIAIALPVVAFVFFIALNAIRLSALAEEVNVSAARRFASDHALNGATATGLQIGTVLSNGARHHQVRPLRRRALALPGREIPLAHPAQGTDHLSFLQPCNSLLPGGNYADSKPLQQTRWITQVHQKRPEPDAVLG